MKPAPDLFSYRPPPPPARYPRAPGHKEGTTSRDAAIAITGRAATLRRKVLAEVAREPGTADEIAARLEETVLAIRPRVTELKAMGLIERTGVRRKNASGQAAHVMRRTCKPIPEGV